MGTKQKEGFKQRLVNFFGSLGYLNVTLQWAMLAVFYLGFIKSLSFFDVSPPEPTVKPAPVVDAEVGGPSLLMIVFAAIIVVFMIMLSIYVFIKMPSTLAKTGRQAVQKTAERTTPLVLKLRHKKDNPKNRKTIKPSLVVAIKSFIILVPVVLAYTSQFVEQSLDFDLVMVVSLFLTGLSIAVFGLQYLLARIMGVDVRNLW